MSRVSLDDKYVATSGRIYLSGIQALVRLTLVQQWRDRAAGLNTAGFVSGYRGSPLGGLDEAFWKAERHLAVNHVKFHPGLNEELAATSVWGTQQVHLIGEANYEGVYAMWYGKAPGVDRCGDVFKHMSHAGTSHHGGVLLVAGDDHGAYSSTLPNQSDHIFAACMIPVLYPGGVQDYLELGLHGWAMSRFAGVPVGFKALADTVESSTSISADVFSLQTVVPANFVMPEGGLNGRLSADPLGVQARKQEALMQDYKIYAALAYARANKLNRTTIGDPNARLGIVASGKSYQDVIEALAELGIDEREANRIGLRLFKVAMPWPLEPDSIREFATGLEEILVVEEKRQIVEYQLKEQLYNWREDVRPRVVGKFDDKGEWVHPRGEWLLPPKEDLSIAQIARVIAGRIQRFHSSELMSQRLALLDAKQAALSTTVTTPVRPAWYCSGCPHNTSTKVPEGSLALAGIGCHVMATAIYPEHNKTTTHMGGEGAPWIGQAPFSKIKHVFANLGDGTYYHSGSLAIRAAVAANVNITYKILYNDAVAMTGGQPVDGPISVPAIARQVADEGVRRIALLAEDPSRWRDAPPLPANGGGIRFSMHHRDELDAVQRELREWIGVSVLIYDQTCAAEKRRRRKKSEMDDPPERIFINELVCEGCGDCGIQSNYTSILPLETEFGRKRTIDQSSCNKDYSCVKGFCPSFVTVTGGVPRKRQARQQDAPSHWPALSAPPRAAIAGTYNVLITGIGGTGVLTVGALLGMAAHLEGKGVSVLDMTGMSQKNGAVTSHVKIATNPGDIHAQRIATGEADLILGCDMLTAASQESVAKTRPGRTAAVINTHQQPPGQFARHPDWTFDDAAMRALIDQSVDGRADYVDATRLATALQGDVIYANLFTLGFAFQKGHIPLDESSLTTAIRLNAVAVDANLQAFVWGRRAAVDVQRVAREAGSEAPVSIQMPESLDKLVRRRVEFLAEYQNAAYAREYECFVQMVRDAEASAVKGDAIAKAVARNLFKLMAYKDEYEVARLYASKSFMDRLKETFEGDFRLSFNLAPPTLAGAATSTRPAKRRYGGYMVHVFRVLAGLKWLRGMRFDPVGRTAERRMERALIGEYRASIAAALGRLDATTARLVLELAGLPERIRGFGHVKQESLGKTRLRWSELEAVLHEGNGPAGNR
jgi:indolepyruvate ferredoxin oxidoreductase